MDETNIRSQVKEHYAAIAKSGGCCDPNSQVSCCTPGETSVNPLVDYSELELIPLEGADLGLGCGVPTAFANLKDGETVLDLGSGAGIDVFLAADKVGPSGKVIGIDMTPEMIGRARENAAKHGYKNVEFRLGEIEQLPVDDASIDIVLSNCVINLVPDKQIAFAEIWRVLKPGGRFCLSDMVTFGNVPAEVRKDVELWAGCVAGAMDRQDYLDLIQEVGFVDVNILKSSEYTGDPNLPAEGERAWGMASITVEARKG